jgi:methionyl-tRNA synthetase
VSDRPRQYLTTPIYYASGEPHIGHAYTTFLVDTLARYHRQSGAEVFFLTGTDDHGQKMQEEASKRGISPRELSDEMAARFAGAWKKMDIQYDRFIRTTEPEHYRVVEAFLTRLYERGFIYDDVYRGWYCVHEERYWTEKDLTPDGGCPDCGRPVQQVEEKNYFFRMSHFQEALIRHLDQNPSWIAPDFRQNEVRGFLQQPLEDLSISRPKTRVQWGIPLPFDDAHVTYVWVDALVNYLTASGAIDAGRPVAEQGWDDQGASWWPADLHIIGKDILTPHAVYWPTMLMAVGLPLPRQILAHGWWLSGKAKMSKSLGNVVDPLELREEFGTDAVRWYLMREMPTGADASYTPDRFLARYGELANVLGNLASRAVSMVHKYRDGTVPESAGGGLDPEIRAAFDTYRASMDALRLHDALEAAMVLARSANVYVETQEPWALAKDAAKAGALDEVLATLVRTLVVLAALFQPVMPAKMAELSRALGLAGTPDFEKALGARPGGLRLEKLPPLFPRREEA